MLSREYGDSWILATAARSVGARDYMAQLYPMLSPEELKAAMRFEKSNPVQAVPSVIVPRELNCLISPEHPQFDELTWGTPEPFRFDPRLIGSAAVG